MKNCPTCKQPMPAAKGKAPMREPVRGADPDRDHDAGADKDGDGDGRPNGFANGGKKKGGGRMPAVLIGFVDHPLPGGPGK